MLLFPLILLTSISLCQATVKDELPRKPTAQQIKPPERTPDRPLTPSLQEPESAANIGPFNGDSHDLLSQKHRNPSDDSKVKGAADNPSDSSEEPGLAKAPLQGQINHRSRERRQDSEFCYPEKYCGEDVASWDREECASDFYCGRNQRNQIACCRTQPTYEDGMLCYDSNLTLGCNNLNHRGCIVGFYCSDSNKCCKRSDSNAMNQQRERREPSCSLGKHCKRDDICRANQIGSCWLILNRCCHSPERMSALTADTAVTVKYINETTWNVTWTRHETDENTEYYFDIMELNYKGFGRFRVVKHLPKCCEHHFKGFKYYRQYGVNLVIVVSDQLKRGKNVMVPNMHDNPKELSDYKKKEWNLSLALVNPTDLRITWENHPTWLGIDKLKSINITYQAIHPFDNPNISLNCTSDMNGCMLPHLIIGLEPNTVYKIRMEVYLLDELDKDMNTSFNWTIETAPRPINCSVESNSSSKMRVKWTDFLGSRRNLDYFVQYKKINNSEKTATIKKESLCRDEQLTSEYIECEYVIYGLSPYQAYSVSVVSKNDAGMSDAVWTTIYTDPSGRPIAISHLLRLNNIVQSMIEACPYDSVTNTSDIVDLLLSSDQTIFNESSWSDSDALARSRTLHKIIFHIGRTLSAKDDLHDRSWKFATALISEVTKKWGYNDTMISDYQARTDDIVYDEHTWTSFMTDLEKLESLLLNNVKINLSNRNNLCAEPNEINGTRGIVASRIVKLNALLKLIRSSDEWEDQENTFMKNATAMTNTFSDDTLSPIAYAMERIGGELGTICNISTSDLSEAIDFMNKTLWDKRSPVMPYSTMKFTRQIIANNLPDVVKLIDLFIELAEPLANEVASKSIIVQNQNKSEAGQSGYDNNTSNGNYSSQSKSIGTSTTSTVNGSLPTDDKIREALISTLTYGRNATPSVYSPSTFDDARIYSNAVVDILAQRKDVFGPNGMEIVEILRNIVNHPSVKVAVASMLQNTPAYDVQNMARETADNLLNTPNQVGKLTAAAKSGPEYILRSKVRVAVGKAEAAIRKKMQDTHTSNPFVLGSRVKMDVAGNHAMQSILAALGRVLPKTSPSRQSVLDTAVVTDVLRSFILSSSGKTFAETNLYDFMEGLVMAARSSDVNEEYMLAIQNRATSSRTSLSAVGEAAAKTDYLSNDASAILTLLNSMIEIINPQPVEGEDTISPDDILKDKFKTGKVSPAQVASKLETDRAVLDELKHLLPAGSSTDNANSPILPVELQKARRCLKVIFDEHKKAAPDKFGGNSWDAALLIANASRVIVENLARKMKHSNSRCRQIIGRMDPEAQKTFLNTMKKKMLDSFPVADPQDIAILKSKFEKMFGELNKYAKKQTTKNYMNFGETFGKDQGKSADKVLQAISDSMGLKLATRRRRTPSTESIDALNGFIETLLGLIGLDSPENLDNLRRFITGLANSVPTQSEVDNLNLAAGTRSGAYARGAAGATKDIGITNGQNSGNMADALEHGLKKMNGEDADPKQIKKLKKKFNKMFNELKKYADKQATKNYTSFGETFGKGQGAEADKALQAIADSMKLKSASRKKRTPSSQSIDAMNGFVNTILNLIRLDSRENLDNLRNLLNGIANGAPTQSGVTNLNGASGTGSGAGAAGGAGATKDFGTNNGANSGNMADALERGLSNMNADDDEDDDDASLWWIGLIVGILLLIIIIIVIVLILRRRKKEQPVEPVPLVVAPDMVSETMTTYGAQVPAVVVTATAVVTTTTTDHLPGDLVTEQTQPSEDVITGATGEQVININVIHVNQDKEDSSTDDIDLFTDAQTDGHVSTDTEQSEVLYNADGTKAAPKEKKKKRIRKSEKKKKLEEKQANKDREEQKNADEKKDDGTEPQIIIINEGHQKSAEQEVKNDKEEEVKEKEKSVKKDETDQIIIIHHHDAPNDELEKPKSQKDVDQSDKDENKTNLENKEKKSTGKESTTKLTANQQDSQPKNIDEENKVARKKSKARSAAKLKEREKTSKPDGSKTQVSRRPGKSKSNIGSLMKTNQNDLRTKSKANIDDEKLEKNERDKIEVDHMDVKANQIKPKPPGIEKELHADPKYETVVEQDQSGTHIQSDNGIDEEREKVKAKKGITGITKITTD